MTGKRGRILHTDDEIDELLERTRSVVVVGVSSDSKRPSRRVSAYLIGATDWTVYLVNPNIDEALGRRRLVTSRTGERSVKVPVCR